jgi:transposase
MTHDYIRHGTTTLFAVLNIIDGTVIGRNMHRHQELIRFLNAIEAEVPAGKAVHVILDNYAAHKHPNVRRWLNRHERFTFHFTPTSCSWLNAVEGFFAKLTSGDQSAVSSSRSSTCRPPSIASSSNSIPSRSPSLGPLILTKLSEPSDAGTKC